MRVDKAKKSLSVNKQVSKPAQFCTYCRKKGHSKDICFKLKKKQQPSNQQSTQSTSQQSTHSSNQRSMQQPQSTDSSESNSNSSNHQQQNGISIPKQFNLGSITNRSGDGWDFDSDCAFHMTPNLNDFCKIDMADGETFVTGNGITQSKGVGSVKIRSFNGDKWIDLYLNNVHYVPTLRTPLFSEPASKPTMISDPNLGVLKLIYNGNVLFTGYRNPLEDNVPYIMNIKVVRSNLNCSVVRVPKDILHKRLGHCP